MSGAGFGRDGQPSYKGEKFDSHKIVIDGIASCIRSEFELARPSWQKFSKSTHLVWFEEFKKRLKWLPEYNDAIWGNFQKRASSKLTQLFQDVRKHLPLKSNWMGNAVFKEMKEHWGKKIRDSNASASLHTSGCVPHRLIYKRMVIIVSGNVKLKNKEE
ncbi:hypothetical protein R3W88_026896 [Solanum pinnatisectum]|uniref:Uncharacterized protein n=1 Tax=Solanum pinnatisectum TaxID=50273 RepID=A0AAV9LEK5_9SOLN|nr:hypothetical protein R3W88_026896 [Solanum pinnatisectum]